MTAPQHSLVTLPDNISFEQAGRFGYIGTSYGALRMADAGPAFAPHPRHSDEPTFIPTSEPDGWPDMFGHHRSAAAELFG